MWKINLKTALRNLKKQRIFSLINIFGMAFGIAMFAVFTTSAGSKLNADRFHENKDRIFGVIQVLSTPNKDTLHTAYVPASLPPSLERDAPGVQDFVRIIPAGKMAVRKGETSFYEGGGLFVDPSFQTVFSFKMKSGPAAGALEGPSAMLITRNFAEKYFGQENPIGRFLILGKETQVQVKGVLENIPRTSSIKFDFLLSIETARSLGRNLAGPEERLGAAFLLLNKEIDQSQAEDQVASAAQKFVRPGKTEIQRTYLFPLTQFRLKGNHIDSFLPSSHPASVLAGFFLGILILLVVSINFINLSTARAMHRTREIGVRKIVGAKRSQLIRQFLGESLLIALIALPAAVLLYEILLPVLNAYLGTFSLETTSSETSKSILYYPFILKYMAVAAGLTGLFSGLYPALFLSAFKPLQALKGSPITGRKKRRASKMMIGFQFTLAVIFIAASGIFKQQIGNLFKADLGWDRSNIAVIRLPGEAVEKKALLKTEFSRHPAVSTVTSCSHIPFIWENPQPVRLPGEPEESARRFHSYTVDFGFIEALKLRIISGRSFSMEQGDHDAFILNQSAANRLGIESPVGKTIQVSDHSGTVVGIAQDFIFSDIGSKIAPAVLTLHPENLGVLLVRYSQSQAFPEIKIYLEERWRQVVPHLPFECSTIEEYFEGIFGMADKIANFLAGVGFLVVVFSCLGLLGLTSFMLERRTKEIGIRKILGASIPQITWTVGKSFLFLVVVADIIALVLISFIWHKVRQTGILFLTDIGPEIYISAVGITLITAIAAVWSQTLKAAAAAPADALRLD